MGILENCLLIILMACGEDSKENLQIWKSTD